MVKKKMMRQSGLVKVTSLDIEGKEQFTESMDHALTSDLEESGFDLSHNLSEDQITNTQKLIEKVEKDIEEDLGGFKTI